MGGEATYFTIKSTSPPLEAGIEEWGITAVLILNKTKGIR